MLRIAGIVGLQIKAIRNYNSGMDYAELHDKATIRQKNIQRRIWLAELQIKTSSSCNLRRCPLQNSMVCLHLEPGILNWFANYQDFGLQNLMLSYCKGIDDFFLV